MRIATASINDIRLEGHRLTGTYHASEDQEAINRLRHFPGRTDALEALCRPGGIFRGPIFRRVFVDSPELGEPYVSARDLVQIDIRPAGYLSLRHGDLLDELRLVEGMILITCSGMNLGDAIWTRAEMAGMAATHDLIRACPDDAKVPPGYLYCFLASRYGRALIRKHIYGGSIKHVEPLHLQPLPIPRLDDETERSIHDLMVRTAGLRTEGNRVLHDAVSSLQRDAALPRPKPAAPGAFESTTARSSTLLRRMDALFHSRYHGEALDSLRRGAFPSVTVRSLSKSVVEPARFKRTKVDSEEFGVRFFGTADLMATNPQPMYLIQKRQARPYIVERRTLLVPRSGQLSGIIGHVVMPHGGIVGGAVSEDAIRVNCVDDDSAGFLLVALSLEQSVRQLKARGYGSSIPHLDITQIGEVLVPDPGPKERARIGALGARVGRLRDSAVQFENEATKLLAAALGEST